MSIQFAEQDRVLVLQGVLQDLHTVRAEINRLEQIVQHEIQENQHENRIMLGA